MATIHDDATPQSAENDSAVTTRTTGDTPEPLCLLDDEHAQAILTTLCSRPQTGRDLADACGISRPTVYRRLDRLEAAGLVTAETRLDPDGHHCKEFRLARDRLTVTIDDGAITVRAEPTA